MRYLKALIAGIVFAAFVEVLGLAVGVLKCLVGLLFHLRWSQSLIWWSNRYRDRVGLGCEK
jgi:hypothetical protein